MRASWAWATEHQLHAQLDTTTHTVVASLPRMGPRQADRDADMQQGSGGDGALGNDEVDGGGEG
eukprot:15273210-Alexandrium_andersonii.AAC.1